MGRYVLIDGDGVAVNTIIWDGVTELTVGEGFALIPESDYKSPVQQSADNEEKQHG